eukprot:758960-Amphidinium_carterae.4
MSTTPKIGSHGGVCTIYVIGIEMYSLPVCPEGIFSSALNTYTATVGIFMSAFNTYSSTEGIFMSAFAMYTASVGIFMSAFTMHSLSLEVLFTNSAADTNKT